MNLLVVGGSGFIGQHFVKQAASKGHDTAVLSLHPVDKPKRILGVKYLEADISSFESLKNTLKDTVFTHLVNLAGYINHAKYFNGGREVINTHFIGVNNLIQCLDWKALKAFVQIGSSDEYGNAPAPQKEDMRENPISPYSTGKVLANHLLQTLFRTEGFPAVILRLFLVYGPGQGNSRFLPQIISGCLKDESFPTSYGKQLRDFCYVDDIVNGIFLALENSQAQGEIINLASGSPIEIRQVMDNVIKLAGGGRPQYGKIPYRTGENMALFADISKAKKILNWKPQISLVDGIAKTLEYYRGL